MQRIYKMLTEDKFSNLESNLSERIEMVQDSLEPAVMQEINNFISE